MSTQVSQREAVFQTIKAALKNEFKEGVKVTLADGHRLSVVDALIKEFQARKIFLKDTPANQEKLKSPALLKNYVNGLVNNWLKRDPRLNGSPKAVPTVIPTSTSSVAAPPITKPDLKPTKDLKRG